MTTSQERKLIKELKEGSQEAFTELYSFYAPKVISFCLRWTKNQTISDDITQETFLRLWNSHSQIRQTDSIKSLLFTIASRSLINEFHKTVNSPIFEQYISHLDDLSTSGTFDPLEYSNFVSSLNKFIDTMPESRSAIVRLSKFEGYSNKEIAEILRLKEQTIKNQLSLALKQLREFIKNSTTILIFLFITQIVF